MDKQPRKQRPKGRKADQEPKRIHPPHARPYLGSGGTLPTGEEGPDVVGTDAGLARVQEHPEDMPGESPDYERSPSRGGWQF